MRKLLAVLGGGWLAWRVFGPETEPAYRGIQSRPLRVPGRSVFVAEREMFVRETGRPDGRILVLVHGWSFDGEMNFHRIIPGLAEHYRLVIPDHRNHGRSEWVRGQFSIEDLADELVGVLDAVGVDKASLFGYSMGGMVAQSVAHRYPGRVEKLILAGTAARPIPRFRLLARIGFWIGRAIARISRSEMAAISRQVLLRSGSIDPAHDRWIHTGLLRRDPTLFYESGHAAWRFDSRAWVGSLSQPTMVIIPTEDQVVWPVTQYELASLIGGDDVVELVGARHESILNQPDEYVKAITRFIG